MSFDFECDDGEHVTSADPVLLLFTIRCSVVQFCRAFKGWVTVLRDLFCEVGIDISIGGLCDSNKVQCFL